MPITMSALGIDIRSRYRLMMLMTKTRLQIKLRKIPELAGLIIMREELRIQIAEDQAILKAISTEIERRVKN